MLDLDPAAKLDPRNTARAQQSAWHVYKRLVGYAWAYKGRLTVAILFAVVVAGSFTAMILSLGATVTISFGNANKSFVFISETTQKIAGEADAPFAATRQWAAREFRDKALRMRGDRMRAVLAVSAAVLLLAALSGIARFFQESFAGEIGANITVRLGQEMYENIMRQPLLFFERHSSGEILARFTNDVFMVNRGLASVFVKLLREPIKAAFFVVAAVSIDPLLTLLGLLILPPVFYVIVQIGKVVRKSMRRSLQKIASMTSVLSETVRGIQIIKGFCMEAYEITRLKAELKKLRRYLVRMVRADAAIGPIAEFLLILGAVAFVIICGRRVEAGALGAGALVNLVGLLAFTMDPLRKLSNVNNMIQSSVASAERVFEFIDVLPDITEAPDAIALPPLQQALRFEDVRFAYDGRAEVLKGLSFEVRRGEMVALVGFSGVDKSTIAKLIPRFYDVTGGAITIDGADIRRATFTSLRDQISIVTQDTILFNESIENNIAFGRNSYSKERIQDAAQAAHAAEFIEALPQGYDTWIGESGGTLSGGQRQRIAIARALIKDPAILILDEATSSLDSESERAIQQAIEEFVVGRTSIVIAHRLSTVQRADRILVIHDGRVAEEGSHRELLDKGGIYRRLYETQFAAPETP